MKTTAQLASEIATTILANGAGAITGPVLATVLQDIITSLVNGNLVGAASGVPALDSNGLVPVTQLPLALQPLATGGASSVTISQLAQALNAQGVLRSLNLPDDVTAPVRVQWDKGLFVKTTDVLGTYVQSALSYSTAQMTTLFALAATFTP